jgi:hypothetical protein
MTIWYIESRYFIRLSSSIFRRDGERNDTEIPNKGQPPGNKELVKEKDEEVGPPRYSSTKATPRGGVKLHEEAHTGRIGRLKRGQEDPSLAEQTLAQG